MRVKEEFKKSGYFWLLSTPKRRIVGTLTISEGGKIELETIDALHINLNDAFHNNKFERAVGIIDGGDSVTLDDCFYKHSFYGTHSVSKFLICANKIFIGVKYEEGKIASFNKAVFSIEGIDE